MPLTVEDDVGKGMSVFADMESAVRIYSRHFPVVFATAIGDEIRDVNGKRYIDFLCGAGALNYGHNPPALKQKLLEYIQSDGITHSLDMATSAKQRFLEMLNKTVLSSLGEQYRVQFAGPAGCIAVEAAIKLARKLTGRRTVISCKGGFHGSSLGALSLTSHRQRRRSAGVPLNDNIIIPFGEDDGDKLQFLTNMLQNDENTQKPAALIVETIQGDGGVRVASNGWLQALQKLLAEHGVIFIVDDIQVGCGRRGSFFSFEKAGLHPDIVCLSKSLSGYGQPMSVNLIKQALDQWQPGEHDGTFRGNNLAFVTATEALRFWQDSDFLQNLQHIEKLLRVALLSLQQACPDLIVDVRGDGLIWGLETKNLQVAESVRHRAFQSGLLVELAGENSTVVKLLPPLNITPERLLEGVGLLKQAFGR